MGKKVLVIATHPDDETLGCGGTILRHKSEGDEVSWLIITSIKNHPYITFEQDVVEKREQVIQNVSAMYQFDKVFQLGIPTVYVHSIDFSLLITKINNVIEIIQPNVIYLNYCADVHSDHRIVFEASYSCTKSFRKPYINSILMYETLSETEFAPAINSATFVPNYFVDITPAFDQKQRIFSLYDTEIMENNLPRSFSAIEALALLRGSRIGVKYAEAFQLLYNKL